MKKTVEVNSKLLKEAKEASGARTVTETIHLGLEALVQQAANRTMQAYLGSEPDAKDVPRRREKAAAKRKIA